MAKYDDNVYPGPGTRMENEKTKIKARRKSKSELDALRRLTLAELLRITDTSDY